MHWEFELANGGDDALKDPVVVSMKFWKLKHMGIQQSTSAVLT